MNAIDRLFEFLQQHAISLSMAYLHSVLPKLTDYYGLDQAILLEQAGITESEWAQAASLLPFYKVAALFFQIWLQTGDPALGVRIGAATQIKAFQMLGYAAMSCATLEQAVQCLLRYEKLAGQLGQTQVRAVDGGFIIEWNNPLESEWAGIVSDAALAGWVSVARTLVQHDIAPLKVYFKHAAPAESGFYQDYFRCPVEFSAACDCVAVAVDQWHLPILSADVILRDLIQREAETQLEKFDEHLNLINCVRAEIWKKLPAGEPRIEQIAAPLQLSPRNLQARLKLAGTNYAAIVEDVRHSAALYHLRDKQLPLLQVAFLLGFAEQSSFNRAFKRWTGMAPSEWRERMVSSEFSVKK
ncbi:MAG TPA: AraC family transcriptional regulator [Pseudomonadales bacterium]|nr:AraC family transcriptional regulator [Pseudomonadales bacterium]